MSETLTPLTDSIAYELRPAPFSYALSRMTDHAEEMERSLTIAHQAYEALQLELDELRQWKESALSVTPPLQEIGRALGLPLGASIHDKILPGIRDFQASQAELIERLNQRVIDFNEADKARIQRIQELEAQLSNQS